MSISLHRAGIPLALILTALTLTPQAARAQLSERQRLAKIDASSVEDVASLGVRPGELGWLDLDDLPGVQVMYLLGDQSGNNPYTLRLKFPAGYELKPHQHHHRRYITVLQGTYVVGFGRTADRARTVEFPVGSYVMIPRNISHFAWADGETVIQVHGNGSFGREWSTQPSER